MSNENKQNDERAAFDDVKPIVDEWMRSRETCMDGSAYGAAIDLAAFVAARATQQATTGDERAADDYPETQDSVHAAQLGVLEFHLRRVVLTYEAGDKAKVPLATVIEGVRDFLVNGGWKRNNVRLFTTPSPVAGSAGQAPTNEELLALHDTEWAKFRKGDSHEPPFRVRFARAALDAYAGAVLSDLQRATIQAAADSAHRVLIAGGDGGDELSDAGLRRELKESRDMLRALLAAHGEKS
ncbi:hypothetical protein [Paraburkholderia tropica]|uniref:hypothetical protein n=1 Tax=Paraburkholderia tropica TaxID=92647 RepID=UPI002AB71EC2|nr:hypothetical protein [Paraburkholderia tropica]